MKNKVSVKGLANIAALVGRTDLPIAPPKKPQRRTVDQIYEHTHEKIVASIEGNDRCSASKILGHYLNAALRDAYNLGHHDALDQNSQVERLLEKQFDARTKVTMPAVAAGIMEQQGLSSMTLDLAHLATVFTRNQIDYTLSDENVIEYRLLPLDVVQA